MINIDYFSDSFIPTKTALENSDTQKDKVLYNILVRIKESPF